MTKRYLAKFLVIIVVFTYSAIGIIIISLTAFYGLDPMEKDENDKVIDVRNWVSMIVALIIPVAFALLLWKYSDFQQREIKDVVTDQKIHLLNLESETLQKSQVIINHVKRFLKNIERLSEELGKDTMKNKEILELIHINMNQTHITISNISRSELDKIRKPEIKNSLQHLINNIQVYCEMGFMKEYPPSKDGLFEDIDEMLSKLQKR